MSVFSLQHLKRQEENRANIIIIGLCSTWLTELGVRREWFTHASNLNYGSSDVCWQVEGIWWNGELGRVDVFVENCSLLFVATTKTVTEEKESCRLQYTFETKDKVKEHVFDRDQQIIHSARQISLDISLHLPSSVNIIWVFFFLAKQIQYSRKRNSHTWARYWVTEK